MARHRGSRASHDGRADCDIGVRTEQSERSRRQVLAVGCNRDKFAGRASARISTGQCSYPGAIGIRLARLMPPDGDTQRGCTKFFPSEMKGVQLDVGRVDMTLCKNASNRDMHVCFSRSAIVAGTESASHGLRSSLGSEKAVDFSKRTLPPRFKNKTKEGSLLGIEISTSFPQRREAGGGHQASAGIGDEETRSRLLQRSRETTHLARISALSLLWTNRRRYVQERAEMS